MNTAGVARPSGSAGKSNFALQTGILVAERRHNGGTGRASQLLKEPADSLQGCNGGGAGHFQTFGAFDERLIGPWSLPQKLLPGRPRDIGVTERRSMPDPSVDPLQSLTHESNIRRVPPDQGPKLGRRRVDELKEVSRTLSEKQDFRRRLSEQGTNGGMR